MLKWLFGKKPKPSRPLRGGEGFSKQRNCPVAVVIRRGSRTEVIAALLERAVVHYTIGRLRSAPRLA